jgi:hypothetical protein
MTANNQDDRKEKSVKGFERNYKKCRFSCVAFAHNDDLPVSAVEGPRVTRQKMRQNDGRGQASVMFSS